MQHAEKDVKTDKEACREYSVHPAAKEVSGKIKAKESKKKRIKQLQIVFGI